VDFEVECFLAPVAVDDVPGQLGNSRRRPVRQRFHRLGHFRGVGAFRVGFVDAHGWLGLQTL
jgi:hypothetical protein